MSTNKKVEQLIAQMENYLECWKQFNQFIKAEIDRWRPLVIDTGVTVD